MSKTHKELTDHFHDLMAKADMLYSKGLSLLEEVQKNNDELEVHEQEIANVLVEMVASGVLQPHEANVCRMECMGMNEQEIANKLFTNKARVIEIRNEVNRKLNDIAAANHPKVVEPTT